jgi:predicted 2-oxoglutarate/Fe(II)-dependent dioxygenase YbiX
MGFAFLQTDLVLQIVHARIAAALALPIMHQEPTNILHYRPGEYYRPHYDFLDPAEATFATSLKRSGQRVATLLIYLNADYEGGETDFPRAAWRFKGAPGDALMFFNVTPDGRPDPMTLHAGLPPIVGEKWLLSKWVRDRALPLI